MEGETDGMALFVATISYSGFGGSFPPVSFTVWNAFLPDV